MSNEWSRTQIMSVAPLFPIFMIFVVPGLLYWWNPPFDTRWSEEISVYPAIFTFVCLGSLFGLALILWTVVLFWKSDGTPVPIKPPPELVVDGPYRHVRNPMLLGAFLIIASEALATGSLLILVWCLLFGSRISYQLACVRRAGT